MRDYHTAQYGAIVTPEDIKRKEEEERKRLEKLERQKNERQPSERQPGEPSRTRRRPGRRTATRVA